MNVAEPKEWPTQSMKQGTSVQHILNIRIMKLIVPPATSRLSFSQMLSGRGGLLPRASLLPWLIIQ